jgi:hypothetical protein
MEAISAYEIDGLIAPVAAFGSKELQPRMNERR